MPNWVYCTTHITGPAEDMARFIAAARKGNRFHHEHNLAQDWGAFSDIQLESLIQEAIEYQNTDSGNEFSFHALYPVPVGVQIMPYDPNVFEAMKKSFGWSAFPVAALCDKYDITMAGYDWDYAHWGTKWGDCNTEIHEVSDTHMSLYFETAWSAPHKFWEKVSADYPTLTFSMSYEEEMLQFAGDAIYEAGEASINEWEPEHESEDESESYQGDGEE